MDVVDNQTKAPLHPVILIVLFFGLLLTWTFNGLWLSIGRHLIPQVAGLPQTLLFIVLTLLILYLPNHPVNIAIITIEKITWLLLAVVLALYLFQFHFGQGNPTLADGILFAVGWGLAFLAWFSWWCHKDILAVIFFLGLVCFVTVPDFYVIPLSSLWHGSQLNLISDATQPLLVGKNPYATVTINYFPALWLPYVPFIAIGLDPRVLNVILFPLIGLIFLLSARRLFLFGTPHYYYLAVTACVIVFLNPGIVQEVMKDQVLLDWLFLSVFALGFLFATPSAIAIGLGLSVAARQISLILLPLGLIVFRAQFKRGVYWFVGLLLLAAVVILPFLIAGPLAFLDATFGYNQRWFIAQWNSTRSQSSQISLSALFFLTERASWMQPLQALLALLISSIYAFWHTRRVSDVIGGFCLLYFVFLLFNPIIWNYYWITLILLLLVLIFAKIREVPSSTRAALDGVCDDKSVLYSPLPAAVQPSTR